MNDRRHLPSPEQQDDILLLLLDGERDELPSDEYVVVVCLRIVLPRDY